MDRVGSIDLGVVEDGRELPAASRLVVSLSEQLLSRAARMGMRRGVLRERDREKVVCPIVPRALLVDLWGVAKEAAGGTGGRHDQSRERRVGERSERPAARSSAEHATVDKWRPQLPTSIPLTLLPVADRGAE
eukprot:765878-Hanusia_phi.AAC.8